MKLSGTAHFVELKFLLLIERLGLQSFFPSLYKEYHRHLKTHLHQDYNLKIKLLQMPFLQSVLAQFDELMLPGDLNHIICRKYYMMQRLKELKKQDNLDAVILLGSGIDALAPWLAQENIACLDIDLPDMIEYKEAILATFPYTKQYHEKLGIDLASSACLVELKNHLAFWTREHKNICIVAEGCIDYIPFNKVAELYKVFKEDDTHKYKFISTFFDLSELSFFHRFVFKQSIKSVGEEIKLGMTFDQMEAFLRLQQANIASITKHKEMINNQSYPKMFNSSALKGFSMLELDI